MPAIVDKIAEALHIKKHESGHPEPTTSTDASTAPATTSGAGPKSQVFDHERVKVFFVLGGPGAGRTSPPVHLTRSKRDTSGKGTQCANLVKDFGFCHLSGM